VNTRDIRTSTAITTCDVCGRTLLRGEHAHAYLDGAQRRSVCELCVSRAVNEGWVREGSVPAFDGGGQRSDRRRSLLGRFRARRDPRRRPETPPQPQPAEPPQWRSWIQPDSRQDREQAPPPARRSWTEPLKRAGREHAREPRHVRAVPTSPEHRVASAVEIFNGSEHRRTVAGVARSLGAPTVSVRPAPSGPSIVDVVVSWELCWYRYEIDLSDDVPSVRVAAQGYELDELAPEQRLANAVSDGDGALSLAMADS
jgi:hypothetical protein